MVVGTKNNHDRGKHLKYSKSRFIKWYNKLFEEQKRNKVRKYLIAITKIRKFNRWDCYQEITGGEIANIFFSPNF